MLRTRRPFFRSRPSRLLVIGSLAVAALTLAIPYSPLAVPLGLEGLSPVLLATLVAITALYVATTEIVKRRFYRASPS